MPALVLLAATTTLAACGKGQGITKTVTVQAPATSRGAGKSGRAGPAKARVRAVAQAINLRPADLPGFHAEPKEKGSSRDGQRFGRAMQQCEGASAQAHPVAEVSSPSFKRNASIAEQSISSSVAVAQTATLAAQELSLLGSAHTRSCLGDAIHLLLPANRGATIGPVKIAHGNPPSSGTAGSFGLRVSSSITVRTVRIPFYMDILGFVYKSTEVTLVSFGLPVPLPAATEQQLYTLLLQRAKAHGI
ncbi:MAG: hypothetical protein ACYDHT_08640 [Solirubrobacteraceae bacterium]